MSHYESWSVTLDTHPVHYFLRKQRTQHPHIAAFIAATDLPKNQKPVTDFRATAQPSPPPRTLNMLQGILRVQRHPWWRFGEFPSPSLSSTSFHTLSTPITTPYDVLNSFKRKPWTVVTSRIGQKNFTAKELSFLSITVHQHKFFLSPKTCGFKCRWMLHQLQTLVRIQNHPPKSNKGHYTEILLANTTASYACIKSHIRTFVLLHSPHFVSIKNSLAPRPLHVLGA